MSVSSIAPCPSCPPCSPGHRCAVYSSSSLTDEQWAVLEPLLPPPGNTTGRGGRPEKYCRRLILDAILYMVRGGIVAADAGGVPACIDGVWDLCPLGPRRGVATNPRRAARSAACAKRSGPLPDRGDHRLADRARADTVPRSRRGWDGGKRTNGVKRHVAVDVTGLLLGVVVTAASIQDRDAAHRLLAALRGSFSTIRLIWADGGYPGRLLGWAKSVLALRVEIIKRRPGSTGFHVRPRVWVIERTFG